MSPDLLLQVVAALTDYLVNTTLAFAVCFLCSRLVNSPNGRLAVWLSFLFGAAGYWLWLATHVFVAGRSVATVYAGSSQAAPSAIGVWHLQGSWALPLGVAMRVAGTVYLAVLLYFLGNHLRHWWRLKWVMKFTTSAPAATEERFKALAHGLGVGRSRLLILSGVSSPATFGWIYPTVLLPDVCLQQDAADLDDIMLHELHHVRRWDFFWNRLATTCRALVFFQPACWYAWRRVNLERELACDLAVVTQTPERRATYAECLIRFARLHAAQEQTAWGLDFAASHHLKARVHSILAGSSKLPVWSVCLRSACGLVLLTGFVGVVPSLGVLLSYTRQVEQPLNSRIIKSLTVAKARPGNRRSRALHAPSAAGPLSAVPNELSEPVQAGMAGTDAEGAETATTPNGSGPQLVHRPLPGTANGSRARQQTVTLLDPDAGERDSKAADRKQALEQTATTALGLYRRLGAVDRH